MATSWNCSKRLTGRKVRILYLEVLMQLLCGSGREDDEAPPVPTLKQTFLHLHFPNLCPQSQQPPVWEGKEVRREVHRVSVTCFTHK